MASPEVNLYVNDESLQINDFVQAFIKSVVTGILSALKGVEGIKSANLSINGDEVKAVVNGAVLPSNAFVQKFLKSTIIGMVTSLKGVGKIYKLEISINS